MLVFGKYRKVHHIETKISQSILKPLIFIFMPNERGENVQSVSVVRIMIKSTMPDTNVPCV